MEYVVDDKFSRTILPIGEKAGEITVKGGEIDGTCGRNSCGSWKRGRPRCGSRLRHHPGRAIADDYGDVDPATSFSERKKRMFQACVESLRTV